MLNLIKFSLTIIVCVQWVAAAPQEPEVQLKDVDKIPENIPICAENNDFNDCMRDAFNYMMTSSVKGIPELNIPPLDPLHHNKLNVQFANEFITGRASIRNITIVGLSKIKFVSMDYKREGNKIKLKVHLVAPKIVIDGGYKAEVTVNNAKFSSKGLFNVSLTDVVSKSDNYAEIYERDGKSYLRLTDVDFTPTLGDMHVWASGLVPDPNLNEAVLQLINESWRPIYNSVIVATKPTWEPILKRYTNDFFSHLPLDLIIKNFQL